ncbi:hypothetical protein [Alkalihalobacillus sp. LMS39]|uniref:MotE family protein n=1 Tax=Alkalihalobacillus sp. LMS39 TaxID=2924032 RepID=UPI001FB49B0A|nr:hypothetical protein [Alkalihalobacillus sp. LMS39]UOE92837.1 hypothetical protein MM271_16640 [Alkalihalobacillus sp. LMS39]
MSEKQKEYSKFQWFFFTGLIPLLFLLLLVFVGAQFLGINLGEKAKEVGSTLPFVSSMIDEEDANQEEEEDAVNVEELLATINEQEAKIADLERQVEQKEEELGLQTELAKELEEQVGLQEEATADVKIELKDIGKTYEAMSAKNAANILSELEVDEAILHMSQISIQTRAAILAKMEAEKAADIMLLLSSQ